MEGSSGCIGTTMKALAAVFALLIIIILPLTIVSHDVARLIFSAEMLSEVLAERLVYSGLFLDVMSEAVPGSQFLREFSPEEAQIDRTIGGISPEEWRGILSVVLPEEWLVREMTESVESVMTWIDDDRPLPNMMITLQPLKERLTGRSGIEVLEIVIDSWPICTADQVAEIESTEARGGVVPILICEPPEPLRGRTVERMAGLVEDYMRRLPGSISLREFEEGAPDIENVRILKERIRLARALSRSVWLLPVALLGMIMALAIRSWRGIAVWWGIPLLLAGVLTGLLGVMATGLSNRWFPRLLDDLQAESPRVHELLVLVLETLRDLILELVYSHAALVVLIGIVLIVLGWFLSRRKGVQGAEMETVSAQQSPPGGVDEGDRPAFSSSPPPVSPMPTDEGENAG